MLGGPADI